VARNGDPQGDDYGLPRIDIVVPDDARELDRDVVAYHRERRQSRRRERWRRLVSPFTRYGLATPIIAAAVLIAVISGTLLTVFGPHAAPRSTGGPTPQRPSARPGQIGGSLPDAQVTVGGRQAALIDQRPAVIVIVPAKCGCDAAVSALARKANTYRISSFVVAGPGTAGGELRQIAKKSTARVLEDTAEILVAAYRPTGLTAVLVHTDGIVSWVQRDLRADQGLDRRIERLQRPGQGLPA
jgi:hypothetical protein